MPTASEVRYGSPLERIRGPVEFIDIPDILKYKAPKVAITSHFSNVASRWQEPKVVLDPDQYYMSDTRVRSPKAVNGVEVPSRWHEPAPTWGPPVTKQIPKTQSVVHTQEYIAHIHYAESVGLGGICSRYKSPQLWEVKADNPRDCVEKKKRDTNATGEMKKFRLGGSCKGTFDEIRVDDDIMKNTSHSRINVQSPVMEWVRRHVPIPGKEAILQGTVERRKSPSRPVSPTRPWKGGAPPQPECRIPMRVSQIAEEEKVAKLLTTMKTAKISFPPAVASLVKSPNESTASSTTIVRRDGNSPRRGSPKRGVTYTSTRSGHGKENGSPIKMQHYKHDKSGINQDIPSLTPSVSCHSQHNGVVRYSSPQGLRLRNKCDTNPATLQKWAVSPTKRSVSITKGVSIATRSTIVDTVSPNSSRRCVSPIPSVSSEASLCLSLPFAAVPPPLVKSLRRD